MNEAKPVAVRWFASGKGTVGVVKVELVDGTSEYRIGAVDGFMEKMDVLQLVAWGAKFPTAAGDALMEG